MSQGGTGCGTELKLPGENVLWPQTEPPPSGDRVHS